MIYENILELIGNTPVVKYSDNIFLKLEYFNPSSSIKDRAAFSMIDNAIKRGEINQDTVIIEPTSGNTGIGLALCCAVLGLKLIICMSENMSDERKKNIASYGAELVLTSKEKGMQGAVEKANELKHHYANSFIPMQFENYDNLKSHKKTAEELLRDFKEEELIITAGIGTGGTAFGLKEFLPKSKIFGIEPFESPLFTTGKSNSHKIQGIGANFRPKITENKNLDGIITIKGDDAIEMAKTLAKTKGIFCGISAGANVLAAIELSKKYSNNKIVAIVPDSGERYLSVW